MPYASKEDQLYYQREWIRKRRERFFKGKKCAKCAGVNHLELDHKDPKSKVSHRIWSWTKSKRDAELEKCQVLCSGCHKQKTKDQCWPIRKHGNRTMYTKGKCRCTLCRKANTTYMRRWRG